MTIDLTEVQVTKTVVQAEIVPTVEGSQTTVAGALESASQVAAAPEPGPSGLTMTEEARRARAQELYDQAIKDAERSLIDANLAEEYAKEELKASKANRIECLQYLQKVRAKGVVEFLRKLEEQETRDKENSKSETKPASSETKQVVETAASVQEPDDSWKLIPTDAILSGIEGLGKKKIELIAEEFKTLGDLEAAREVAGKEFKQFHEMFPRGIGPKTVDEIEERMYEATKSYMQICKSKPSPPIVQEISEVPPEKIPIELDPDL